MSSLNVELFRAINGFAGSSHLLDFIGVVLAKYLVFSVPIYLIWLFLKKNDFFKHESLFAFYSSIIGLFINYILSLFYFYPRPFVLHLGEQLIGHVPDSSFPSDHVTLILSVGFYLLLQERLRVHGVIFIVLGFLVGLSRVFCGIHWPFDIAGSFIVSIVAVFIVIFNKDRLVIINKFVIYIYYMALDLWHELLKK